MFEAAARPPSAAPRSAIVCGLLRVGDDALRHRADGYRLLDSALVGLPGVKRLAHQRFRRSAFADVQRTACCCSRPWTGHRRS